jgi:SnoaL-like domain
VLVCSAGDDLFFAGDGTTTPQPQELYGHLTAPAHLQHFTAAEGADAHGHAGAERLAAARIFGDSATASVNILTWLRREAAHDGPMWSNGAVGKITLTRTSDRWRIAGITARPTWAEGNRGVLDPAH